MLNDPLTPLTLYIILSRTLTSPSMISGLITAVTPFLSADLTAVETFREANPSSESFPAGSVLRFDVGSSATTYTHPNGTKHVVASREFARGIKGAYFQGDGVVKGLKANTVEGIRKLGL